MNDNKANEVALVPDRLMLYDAIKAMSLSPTGVTRHPV